MAMRAASLSPPSPAPTRKDPDAWPFTSWPTVVVLHTGAAFTVLGLGTAILFMHKGTYAHRIMGRVWAGAMLLTSFSSFGIKGLSGHISFIHGLSVYVILSVSAGVYHIRQNNVKSHKWHMKGSFYVSLLAGLLTIVIPGRRFYNLLFGVPKDD